MNILISSNTANKVGGENFNNDFVVTLPESIDGENSNKSIRVLNVAYPQTIENVGLEKCGIKLIFTCDLDYNDPSDNNAFYGGRIKFTTGWLFLPAGQYDMETLLNTLNALVDEYDVFFYTLNGGRVGVNFATTLTNMYKAKNVMPIVTLTHPFKGTVCYVFNEQTNMINIVMTKTLEYMLGLTKLVLHPEVLKYKKIAPKRDQTVWDYICEYLALHRATSTDVDNTHTLCYGKYLTDITNGLTTIFIYCDEVDRSVVGDTNSRLLTCVHIQKGDVTSGELVAYTPPPFTMRLIKSKIEKFHITLRDTEYNLIQFSAGTVNISCVVE
jgi:hypothetical protein